MLKVCEKHKKLGRKFTTFVTHVGDKWFGALMQCDLPHCDEVAVGTLSS